MLPASLSDWLTHLEALHPKSIELGLERVAQVRRALDLTLAFPIITVGGTNGKGSTCALLEAIYTRAGYRVGCYTSPHLLRYNERVKINAVPATDAELCAAFAAVEAARGTTPLTYFEFGTLAALWLFAHSTLDVGILEVGLGGRLDAVNAFDPDCAVVTNVDLDHMDYLGDNVEAIGREKAGIYRSARAALFGDAVMPASVAAEAARIGADFIVFNRDYGYQRRATHWDFWGRCGKRYGLPFPALRGAYQLNNAATCIAALDEIHARVPVTLQDIKRGLLEVDLPGRFQVLPGRPSVILDVAHNPHAAGALAANLRALPGKGRTLALFSMLRDKDIAGVVRAVRDRVDQWFIAPIEAARGATLDHLAHALAAEGVQDAVSRCANLGAAYAEARRQAAQDDRIIAFGSFYTVAEVLKQHKVTSSSHAASTT